MSYFFLRLPFLFYFIFFSLFAFACFIYFFLVFIISRSLLSLLPSFLFKLSLFLSCIPLCLFPFISKGMHRLNDFFALIAIGEDPRASAPVVCRILRSCRILRACRILRQFHRRCFSSFGFNLWFSGFILQEKFVPFEIALRLSFDYINLLLGLLDFSLALIRGRLHFSFLAVSHACL